MEYAPLHILIIFKVTLFCKKKEFNSKIIFVLIYDYDFGHYVGNSIKCHFWLNAYFLKNCIEIVTVYGLAPK